MAKLLPPKPTLKEEHECLRGLIENSDLGFYRLDTEGRIVEWNATLVDMLGLFADQAEISGRPIWTFVDKDESERFRAAVKRQLKNLDTVFEPAAVTFICGDGQSLFASVNAAPIRNPHGATDSLMAIVRDISAGAEIARALQDPLLYASIVEDASIPIYILRKGASGRFTFANKNVCVELDRSLDEIRGRLDEAFFGGHSGIVYRAADNRVLATGQPFEAIERHIVVDHRTGHHIENEVQVVKTPYLTEKGETEIQVSYWFVRQRDTVLAAIKDKKSRLDLQQHHLMEPAKPPSHG